MPNHGHLDVYLAFFRAKNATHEDIKSGCIVDLSLRCPGCVTNCRPMIVIPSSLASLIISGLSIIIIFKAYTTRHFPPFFDRLLIVAGP